MKSTIYIPKKIKIGFQNREDTYTGKLGYVIYYDEKGKLRKETSWESWRDKNIEPLELDNVPMEGFVLNKKAGDYNSGWGNHRMAYTRVYHPNGGWEFEITIENLLYILEHCTSTKGKGLEGELILGWDGKNHVLLPVDSSDYKAISEYSKKKGEQFKLGARTVKVGATYLTKENQEWVYMGRFHDYETSYKKNIELPNGDFYYAQNKSEKTKFFFVSINSDGEYRLHIETGNWHKFIAELDDSPHEQYADMYSFMERDLHFSPVNIESTAYTPFTLEEFENYINKCFKRDEDGSFKYTWSSASLTTKTTGKLQHIKLEYNKNREVFYVEVIHLTQEDYVPYYAYGEKRMRDVKHYYKAILGSLEDVYEKLEPMYQTLYLENGCKYKEDK